MNEISTQNRFNILENDKLVLMTHNICISPPMTPPMQSRMLQSKSKLCSPSKTSHDSELVNE